MTALQSVLPSSIYRRLIAGGVVLAVGLLITIAMAWSGLHQIRADYTSAAGRAVPYTNDLSTFAVSAKAMAADERGFLLSNDPSFSDEFDTKHGQAAQDALAAAAKVYPAGSPEAKTVAKIEAGFTAWIAAVHTEFTQYKTDKAGAVTIALGANRDLRKAYEANVDAGDALAATDLAATSHGLSSSISHTTTIVIAMLGLVIVLGAALLILFARSLRRRLATLAAACDQLATGDLDATFEASGDDEVSGLARSLGTAVGSLRALADTSQRVAAGDLTVTVEPRSDKDSLGVSFAAMVENLRGIVAEVTSTARTISSSTTQMAATSSDAGRTAGEIARAVDDVAQGAQRQVIMIDETRTSAEQAAGVANDAQIVAREGVESADKAGNAMEALQESSTAMTGAMGSLQEKIERIGGMVSTITAIADQTNLLALNAAIEAARAGEQGRGFAVVAEEVRKLAEECQGAASQISGLIGQIQSETTRAVDVVEDGSRRTAEGVEVVERARDSFLRLGGAVDEMASMIGRIAAATAEVASVTEQSSASAQQVSASTQETSSSAEEIAASARSLADTAVMLTDAVGRFQTNA
jgi:methyl-accepting chemotaxis protein